MKKSIALSKEPSTTASQSANPMKNFVSLGTIGHGAFSQVHKVRRVSDGKIYALKKIKLHSLKPKQQQYAISEIKILAALSCPYIISFRQSFYDSEAEQLCIVMEWANEGDLHSDVEKRRKNATQSNKNSGVYSKANKNVGSQGTPQSQIWRAVRDILSGLAVLHEASILHRDIKSANIFKSQGIYKLGDLNIAKICPGLAYAYTQTGTPYYASPQVWKQLPYNTKSDIWSFGCVIYEMCQLSPPFMGADMKDLYQMIIRGRYRPIKSQYSKQLTDLIALCLKVDPKQRKSCNQLLNLPWVKQKLVQHNIISLNIENTPTKQSLLHKSVQQNDNTYNTNRSSANNNNAHQQSEHKYPKQLSIKLTKQLRELRSITEPTNNIQEIGSCQQKSIQLNKNGVNGSYNNSLVYRYGPDKFNQLLPQANYPSQAKRGKKVSNISMVNSTQHKNNEINTNKITQQLQSKIKDIPKTNQKQAKYISSIPLSQSMQSDTIIKMNANQQKQSKQKQKVYDIGNQVSKQKQNIVKTAVQQQHHINNGINNKDSINISNQQQSKSYKQQQTHNNDTNKNNNINSNSNRQIGNRKSRKLITSHGPLTILKSNSHKLRPASPGAYIIQCTNSKSKRKLIRPIRTQAQNSKHNLVNVSNNNNNRVIDDYKNNMSNKLLLNDNDVPANITSVKHEQECKNIGKQISRSVTLIQQSTEPKQQIQACRISSKIAKTESNQNQQITQICNKYRNKQQYSGRPYLNKIYANNHPSSAHNNYNNNNNNRGYIINGRRRPFSSSQPRTMNRYDGYIHQPNSGRINSMHHHNTNNSGSGNRVASASLIQPSYSSNKVLKQANSNQLHSASNNNNNSSNSNNKIAGLIYTSNNNNNNKCSLGPYMPMPSYMQYMPKLQNIPYNTNSNNNGYMDGRHGHVQQQQPIMQDLPRIRNMLVNRSSNVRQQIGKLYYNYSQYNHNYNHNHNINKDAYQYRSRNNNNINRSRDNLL